ncbi:hypothetical protein LAZ67_14002585 [Cordylochernes scorpioides]|uniref:BPTI/Kunitz inhibitor domain-containing protein n=1 Tax=Cordylochernes scorpioides TaxID=51811 RepID=A0ABY6LAL8_9ARAC|nr:hypothetical protein LAZ67_14002585 [Cordylochernes scorpioides]
MLEMTRTDPEWKDKIITGYETWVYGYDPETKHQSAEWRCQVIVAVYACGVDVEKGPIRQQLWNAPPCDNVESWFGAQSRMIPDHQPECQAEKQIDDCEENEDYNVYYNYTTSTCIELPEGLCAKGINRYRSLSDCNNYCNHPPITTTTPEA